MKKKLLLYITCIASILIVSCDDFLEKPPSIDVTEDTVFENIVNARQMLYTLYTGIPYGLPREAGNTFQRGWRCMLNAITDEADGGASWCDSHRYNNGAINATNIDSGENDYHLNYKLIRYAWRFVERIDEVPDATDAEKTMFKAEARMLIAMQYYEMIIRMGGVPWVDHAYLADENWRAERMPLAELVEKVEGLIDEAMVDLPDSRPDVEQGRLTKGFGYFLKSRLKLVIARPLFNTGTPFLVMEDPEKNNLICMGNSDPNRYKEAADVCQAAIFHLESQGRRLLQPEDLKSIGINNGSKQDAYSLACRKPNHINPEMVHYTMRGKNMGIWTNWAAALGPRVEGNGFSQPTENFKRLYQLSNGKPQTIENGYDPNYPFDGLDPRFDASYIRHATDFGNRFYTMVLGDDVVTAEQNDQRRPWLVGRASTERSRTGYHLRKMVQEEMYGPTGIPGTPIWPYMRMAELYLSYAEALNEYHKGPNTEVYKYVNLVRTRCGMPAVENLDYNQMKEIIEYERTIELAFEGQRYFDQKQWLKAENVFDQPIISFDIIRDPNDKKKLIYSTSVLESRVFEKRNYLDPFPLSEINMNYGLVQNPGWE